MATHSRGRGARGPSRQRLPRVPTPSSQAGDHVPLGTPGHQDPDVPSTSGQSTTPPGTASSSTRHRGVTRALELSRLTEKKMLSWHLGSFVGEHSASASTWLGQVIRTRAPIVGCKGWAAVTPGDRELLYQAFLEKFDWADRTQPDQDHRTDLFDRLSKRYRDYRYDLHTAYSYLAEPESTDDQIVEALSHPDAPSAEVLRYLVELWRSPQFQAKSQSNKANRDSSDTPAPLLGRISMARLDRQMADDLGHDPTRLQKYERSRRKNKGRGDFRDPRAAEHVLDELKEYLASSGESDDDSGDSEDKRHSRKREKLRSLLQQPNDDPDSDHSEDKDMEVTFNTELEDVSKRILEKQDEKSKTVWETVVQKRSEKRKSRRQRSKHDDTTDSDDFFLEETICKSRAGGERNQVKTREGEASRDELELLFAGEHGDDGGPKGYNLKRKKGKGKKDEDKPVNVECAADPRFSALFTSHLFALDPTDPQFKRSATYARQRRRKTGEEEEEDAMNPCEGARSKSDDNDEERIPVGLSASEKERHQLSATVRSLKRKLVTVKDKPKIPF